MCELTARLRSHSKPPAQAPMPGSVLLETALFGKRRHAVSASASHSRCIRKPRLAVASGGNEYRHRHAILDAILIQDIGLGDRGFLMNNEAYASQYIDHHVARHPVYGQVVMSRQNLTQGGLNPWVAHGCLDGASGFATDGMQLFGPPSATEMRLALHLEQACRTRGCSTSSLVPRSNPRQPRWRRALARPGASSAFMCPIIRKHRAMAISRGSMP